MVEIFALIILLVLFAVALVVIWIIGALPGKIARQRGHAQAEAVNVAGWVSLLMPLPLWPLALIWAYLNPGPLLRAQPSSEVVNK